MITITIIFYYNKRLLKREKNKKSNTQKVKIGEKWKVKGLILRGKEADGKRRDGGMEKTEGGRER